MSTKPCFVRADPDRTAPWNRGLAVGQKRPFTAEQVLTIAKEAYRQGLTRDHALFYLGIDSMLRGKDLTQLTLADVLDSQCRVLPEIQVVQSKTGQSVTCRLSIYTQNSLLNLAEKRKFLRDEFLFSPLRSGASGLCRLVIYAAGSRFGRLWRDWTLLIIPVILCGGRNPRFFTPMA